MVLPSFSVAQHEDNVHSNQQHELLLLMHVLLTELLNMHITLQLYLYCYLLLL
jgi:hypothetical protein